MSIYVVGDIQGCFDDFYCLYQKLEINPKKDEVWLAGDLVNRGPKSLETLRFVFQNQDHIKTVLGNHDLHLLAIHSGAVAVKKKDTLLAILEAPDCDELMSWLRKQPLAIHHTEKDFVLSHAGIPHIWSVDQALSFASEVEAVLKSSDADKYFQAMYGNEPNRWEDGLDGLVRLRVITNYFTRMRFISKGGALDFKAKEDPASAPYGFVPWYSLEREDTTRLFFGHWAALMGETQRSQFVGLDTGCVWGKYITAEDVDSGQRYSCDCAKERNVQ